MSKKSKLYSQQEIDISTNEHKYKTISKLNRSVKLTSVVEEANKHNEFAEHIACSSNEVVSSDEQG